MTANEQIRAYNRSIDYLQGKDVPQDSRKSFELNAEAARHGYRNAVLAMGWYYLGGVGVERDLEKAKKWYRKSARHGQPMAMFSLGRIARIQQDFVEAVSWFMRASEAGHSRSLYFLGKHHWYGQGVPQDRKEAVRLFHLAADKNVKEARRVLKYLTRTIRKR